jgi:hypothetical protein
LEADYNAGKTHLDKIGRRATIIVLGERKELKDLAPHMRNHHRIFAIALGTMMVPNGLDLHVMRNHRGTAAVPDMEAEVDDPDHHNEHMIIHAKEMPETQSRKYGSTYKRPASIEELISFTQEYNELLRSYIQCWSTVKNSAEDVSDEMAVDASVPGLHCPQFSEEMGRLKPRRVLELMDIANKFVDGEVIRLKHIYNFLCSMLVYTPFALCFVILRGIFMHFLEVTY